MRPSSDARLTASQRLAAPSLASTAATWCSAVRGETTRRSAISAFASPFARSASTSSWREVSPAGIRARRVARAPRDAQAEVAHPLRDAPDERLGAEAARDVDRLRERLLVVEEREHQGPVVGPAHLAEAVGSRRPVAARHRGEDRRAVVAGHVVARDRRPGRDARAAPAAHAAPRLVLLHEAVEALERHRPAAGERPLDSKLEHGRQALEVACTVGMLGEIGQPGRGVGVPPPHRELGDHDLREQLRDRGTALELAAGGALGRRPLPAPEAQPREHHLDVRHEVLHLVLACVRKGFDRVPPAPARAPPTSSGRSPRLPSARPASSRSPAACATACASSSDAPSAKSTCVRAVPRFTSACARVRSSPSRVASSSARCPQTSACSVSWASIACCENPLYARASSTDSPSGSRISIASSAFAHAMSPSPANQWSREKMRVQRPTASTSPSSR